MEVNLLKEIDDVNWNEYFIAGTKILKNKFDITSQEALSNKESEIVIEELVKLHLESEGCAMNIQSLLDIHRHLFGEIYFFAGQIRECSLSKNGYNFTDPTLICKELENIFNEYEPLINSSYSPTQYAHVLAPFYYDLIRVHPFREGNGRTIREFVREIVLEKNKILPFQVELDYSKMDKENLLLGTKERYLYGSLLEFEFMKALIPIEKNKEQGNKK